MPDALQTASLLAAFQKAADECLARVRQPDADHPSEWACTWLDAIDVVKSATAAMTEAKPAVTIPYEVAEAALEALDRLGWSQEASRVDDAMTRAMIHPAE